jgi:hypothetical protein
MVHKIPVSYELLRILVRISHSEEEIASKFHDKKLGGEDSRTNFTLSYSNKSIQV